MSKRLLYLVFFFALPYLANAQIARTIDGTGNNLSNPTWGSAGEQLTRICSVNYADSISSPGGVDRPNPRIISNLLFAQDTLFQDPLSLSDFVWVFGQFIDHDIVSVSSDPTEPAGIPVNFPDEHFNPGGVFPNVEIHMSRTLEASGTGTATNNPRQHANNITGWIDGSSVYGSDTDRADYLRTFVDGKLKTSVGDLLPYNTTNNEQGAPIDSDAPFMDNENPFNSTLFVAGDSRANEQPLLACFHTLFVREHNRLCEEYKIENPSWTDAQLYDKARRVVGALIQSVVYEQWLPTMGVHLPAYTGYDATVNSNISNEFSAAAFRMGHTLLNSTIRRIDIGGEDIIPAMTLAEAFFNPFDIATNGMDPFFRGMAAQIEQDLDGKVVSDVRNFLFGPPGNGGLDLASININRGRERGLPDFNTMRMDSGLPAYNTFQEINSDPTVYTVLESLYTDVNDIDPWVGLLVEDHMPDALFGETIMHIMMEQFAVLRDGDRFYYEVDPVLSQEEKDSIKNTVLSDIIMRNTGVDVMQENVFRAMEFDSICMAPLSTAELAGGIQTTGATTVADVEIEVTDENGMLLYADVTSNLGDFLIEEVATCEYYTITPEKDVNALNGVTTYDLVNIIQHALDVEYLDSPYKIIAADANADGQVTTFDVVLLRKLILFLETTVVGNTAWRFVDADYVFDEPTNPLAEDFPEHREVTMLSEDMALDFVAIKIGDINNSADGNLFNAGADDRTDETLLFELTDQNLEEGETVVVPFYANNIMDVAGFQFTLNYNTEHLTLASIEQVTLPTLSQNNFGVLAEDGAITSSWNGTTSGLNEDDVLFNLHFEVTKSGKLSDQLSLNSRFTLAEAYTSNDLSIMDVVLRFKDESGTELTPAGFELYQNKPNPFKGNTSIGFSLSENSDVSLKVFDVTGRLVTVTQNNYAEGYHEIEINESVLSSAGSVFYYQIETVFGTAIKKMILVK